MFTRWLTSRRSMLRAAGLGSLAAGIAALGSRGRAADVSDADHRLHGHDMGAVGRTDTSIFNPTTYLRSFNFSHLEPAERARFYRETPREDGSLVREYE